MTPLVLPLAGLVLVLAQIIYGSQMQAKTEDSMNQASTATLLGLKGYCRYFV